MNAALILIISIAALVAGYIFYGGWLAKEWGIDAKRPTPAHELNDGVDYVPAKAPVIMAAGSPFSCGSWSAVSSSAACTISARCSHRSATKVSP